MKREQYKFLLILGWLLFLLPACGPSPRERAIQPQGTLEQLAFEVQTVTPTPTPFLPLDSVATYTPGPATTTPTLTATLTPTTVAAPRQTPAPADSPPMAVEVSDTPAAPALPPAEPLQGGAWDFEEGFVEWGNPFGDPCSGATLAVGWHAFTTRDQYGSSCMNQTSWKDNVYSGQYAQEITFAYIGNQAGIFRAAPTIPGHQYKIEAHMRREFSVSTVEVLLGVDVGGGVDWQATSVQWFPWDEQLDNAWAKTEETVTATGDSMTLFIRGNHPYPEPGGVLTLDAITITDLGAQ